MPKFSVVSVYLHRQLHSLFTGLFQVSEQANGFYVCVVLLQTVLNATVTWSLGSMLP